jgi:hypothetical protein
MNMYKRRLPKPRLPFLAVPLRLRLRFYRDGLIAGALLSLCVYVPISLYMYDRAAIALMEATHNETETHLRREHAAKTMETLLDTPGIVNTVCNKWWFGMDHTQRKLKPS